MEINTAASLRVSLDNAPGGKDIPKRSQEKIENTQERSQDVERPEAGRISGSASRRIDIYA